MVSERGTVSFCGQTSCKFSSCNVVVGSQTHRTLHTRSRAQAAGKIAAVLLTVLLSAITSLLRTGQLEANS